MGIIETIIAGLIVAGVSGGAGWGLKKLQTRKKIKALPKKWVERIDGLIKKAIIEGQDKCIINAKAIVASRDAMRKSLITLTNTLNSEVDKLALTIGESVEKPERFTRDSEYEANVEKVWEQLQVLERYWEIKGDEIEDGIRKVITELGLDDI
ncbi:MAG: hypothetical protein AB2692_04830 [Candidatus Thiodiazotropha sp.]